MIEKAYHISVKDIPGAGAAGGLELVFSLSSMRHYLMASILS